VPQSVPVFGPFSGQLNDTGESLRLWRPDSSGVGGLAQILVDEVEYSNQLPWPAAADGIGPSLQRLVESAYGNDPTNWTAAPPSVGAAFVPGGVPPTIITGPADRTVAAGRTAMFSVDVAGAPPFLYQWRLNGTNLQDAYSSTLTLPNVQFSQAGSYSVVVINLSGSVESPAAQLTVLSPPVITQQPIGRSVFIKPDAGAVNLPNGTNVTFTIAASSINSAISYQWTFNGVPIPGATSTSLTITNVQLESEGDYVCAVTDTVDTVLSASARLVPWIRPIVQRVSPPPIEAAGGNTYTNVIPAGSTINFAAVVFGNPPPFGYVWRSNSLSIITNLTSSATNVFPFKTGPNPITATYRVIVTNPAQPNVAAGVWSATFYIRTVADNDQDGISDEYEVANGFDTNNAADALGDLDLDGSNNRAEFIAGTDPNNNQSYLKVELDAPPGAATVEVSAIANRSYTVQYTDAFGTGQWLKLGDVFPRATNRVEVITDPNWTTNRFYRVVVPQQP